MWIFCRVVRYDRDVLPVVAGFRFLPTWSLPDGSVRIYDQSLLVYIRWDFRN